ncbi:unnamed protein product [Rotaria socialis]|uniref:Phosphoacetylglucosamine mutase n=1 Tax=Rotaria socialis TaxID=392032 RepID=A0A817QKB9_9BILA|nr:unnamed protein product [Rotaria socialis]CAF3313651.1 unnamed protein product [Rotaria socialis]
MGEIAKEKLAALLLEYPKPSGIILGYGTAGFRARADTLPWIMIRIGLLASLRSKVKKACIGAMVTASHNPEHDNGVKLIDPFGEMLDQSWEIYASNLSSLDDSIDALWNYLEKLMAQLNVQLKDKATVAIAYDTRQSSPLLSHIVQRAAEIFNTNIINYELMTTPQLHYTVRCYNDNELYGRCTEVGYFDKICTAFKNLIEMTPGAKHLEQLAIDAANGIGAQKLVVLQQRLSDLFKIEIFNDGTQGRLNEKCGADYVKLYQKAPEGLPLTNYPKYCSIDGDADRLIYYFIDQNQHFRMLDGDRFSVLFASFISKKLKEAKLIDQVKIGVIQTAYANGSSTNYVINTMNVPVACVPTGVKHLHHKALDFDVGIYFEANGHGTVLFSDDLKTRVKSVMEDENRPDDEKLAAKQLHVFIDIINETVGDALADLLATEAILCLMNLSIEGWLDLYHDLPQRQLKVAVKDRTMIQTTDAERRCTAPAHLQDCIDELVSKYPSGRSFVRPSGTEDIVRVYAEATTQADADQLADEVRKIVQELTK